MSKEPETMKEDVLNWVCEKCNGRIERGQLCYWVPRGNEITYLHAECCDEQNEPR